jgi:nitrate/nitrite transport system permease protein
MTQPAQVIALPGTAIGVPTKQSELHPLKPKPVSFATRAKRTGLAVASRLAPPVVTIALLLLLWQMLASSPTSALPSPLKVIDESWEIIVDPFKLGSGIDQGLFWHVAASLTRVAYGFILAAIAGIAVGVLLGQSTLAMRGLDPVFQVLRTIPPLAWLPLSLAAFRDGQPSAIFVIFITSVWPILINTTVGIRNIPQDYRNVAKVLRLSPIEFFTRIMVPATVPHMFTGLRIGIGLSWLAIVAAEMLIGGVGIGFFIWDAWNSSLISDIIVALVYVGIVGFLLDRLIAAIGHMLTRGTAAQ